MKLKLSGGYGWTLKIDGSIRLSVAMLGFAMLSERRRWVDRKDDGIQLSAAMLGYMD